MAFSMAFTNTHLQQLQQSTTAAQQLLRSYCSITAVTAVGTAVVTAVTAVVTEVTAVVTAVTAVTPEYAPESLQSIGMEP